MRKAFIVILTAFLIVSLFIACKDDPDPIPEITIGFEKNCESATGEMGNLTVRKGEAANLPENKYERTDGYSFIGWNTKADGSGDAYTDGDTVCFENDTTLYALWDKEVIKITFEANGGSGWMLPQWVLYDEASVLRPNRFTKEGYDFVGWNTQADGSGDAYCDSDTVYLKENTTLYAQWSKEVEKITFEANGGSGWMLPQWVLYDTATALKPNRFKQTGYVFVGWNTKADGSGDSYPDGDTVSLKENTTLYAQWEMEVVTIKFNFNGGSGRMSPQSVQKGVATALKQNTFRYYEHCFMGWNTKADGTGTKYADQAMITVESDIILYAQWAVDICALKDKYNWNESDGKYFSFSEDLTLEEHRPDVNGSIILFLPEGKTLSLGFGLGVTRGNSLTIEGTGNLEAVGTSVAYSGIGGDGETLWIACGDITINGGNIYAKGGAGGAGIGGAYCCNSGTITINGGTVEAVGGSSDWFGYEGAGIGGGGRGSNGTVIINGGKVTATGRENSDGIGKGQDGKDKGKLTLGKGVSIEVSDDNKTWSPYKSNTRHRYMRTK